MSRPTKIIKPPVVHRITLIVDDTVCQGVRNLLYIKRVAGFDYYTATDEFAGHICKAIEGGKTEIKLVKKPVKAAKGAKP